MRRRGALRACRANWALFATHQAVEKALKAAIMTKNRRPPKTSDLTELYNELGGAEREAC
ncbi:MAG: HEPN domain-containing protein [Candidatus Freyarchaeota archaeon]|nr:HEPN domain-containing protein [Candidatus Jordarchaeia archaeon]